MFQHETFDEATSSSLIAKVQDDDQAAWQRLVCLYSPLVYKWVRNVGLQPHDSADIGQEVFRTLHAKIAGFSKRNLKGGFRSWLWQITRNKVGDHIRQSRVQERPLGEKSTGLNTFYLPVEYSEESKVEDTADLMAAIFQLIQNDFQPHTWKAFWRATVDEVPMDQIAEELGMSNKAVRQAKYRVLKRLRDEFGDLLT